MKLMADTGLRSKKFSILFCTHNSARVIAEALKAVQKQSALDAVCEVIIVDYKSTDDTLQIVNAVFQEFPMPMVLVNCEMPGKSPAIILGLNKAQGDYIIVVDDDNILAEDFVEVAQNILVDDQIGCLGARGFMADENMSSLPEWFERHKGVYAIGLPNNGIITDWVWGAGSIVNRRAWNRLSEKSFSFKLNPARLTSSTPISIGGEDVELSLAIRLLGYKVEASEALHFIHKFEPSRLNEAYLLKTAFGVSRAVVIHEIYRIAGASSSSRSLLVTLHWRILRKLVGLTISILRNCIRINYLDARYAMRTLMGIFSGYLLYRSQCGQIAEYVLSIKSQAE